MEIIGNILGVCAVIAFLHFIGISPQFDNPVEDIKKLPKVLRWLMYSYTVVVLIGYLALIGIVILFIYFLFTK